MPIYEYECEDCDHQLEALQKVSDPLLTDCPSCGQPALRKCISAPSFRLKGGGWYETDFKTGNKRNLADDARGSEAKPDKDKSAKPADGDSGKNKTAAASASREKPKTTNGGAGGSAD